MERVNTVGGGGGEELIYVKKVIGTNGRQTVRQTDRQEVQTSWVRQKRKGIGQKSQTREVRQSGKMGCKLR